MKTALRRLLLALLPAAATFGVFAVRGEARASPDADFDYLHVTYP